MWHASGTEPCTIFYTSAIDTCTISVQHQHLSCHLSWKGSRVFTNILQVQSEHKPVRPNPWLSAVELTINQVVDSVFLRETTPMFIDRLVLVGDNVAVPISLVDRGRGDPGISLDWSHVTIQKKIYKISVRDGVLKGHFSRNHFQLCPQEFLYRNRCETRSGTISPWSSYQTVNVWRTRIHKMLLWSQKV